MSLIRSLDDLPPAERELRRKISQNLENIRSGKYRREREAKQRDKRSELEKAQAWEIELGYTILQRREYNKELNRLLLKPGLTREEELAAEELQGMVDRFDQEIGDMTRAEQTRCVRLWNKSRRVRYALRS